MCHLIKYMLFDHTCVISSNMCYLIKMYYLIKNVLNDTKFVI